MSTSKDGAQQSHTSYLISHRCSRSCPEPRIIYEGRLFPATKQNIIVIGASAGRVERLQESVSSAKEDLKLLREILDRL
jgi:hypothetical protein